MLLVRKDALAHGCKVAPRPDDEDHEEDREPGIEVEGDCVQEEREAVDGRIFRQGRADGGGPARYRSDDADRRSRRIDDVRKLRARDLELVGDRAHDGADRQAVKVIIDEDNDAEQCCQEQCAARAVDGPDGPVAIRPGCARARDGGHEDAEDDEENEDVDVTADFIGHNLKHREDCREDVAAREEQCSRENTDDQRHVDLFGPQCQDDRDDWREN